MRWYNLLIGLFVISILLVVFFEEANVIWLACIITIWAVVTGLGVALIRLRLFVPAVLKLQPEQPCIALTYDDGPDPNVTPLLLDFLDTLEVKATFFCVGKHVNNHPELAREIVQRGHLIANHSDCHPWWLPFCLSRGWQREIERGAMAIKRATNITTTLFRPPMGLTNPHLNVALKKTQHHCVGWTVRSLDRAPLSTQAVCERVKRRICPGAIVLLHDRGQEPDCVLTLTRSIVEYARENGYRCIRLDEAIPLERTRKTSSTTHA